MTLLWMGILRLQELFNRSNMYRVIPLIFPRSNFKLKRLDSLLSYPSSIFGSERLEEGKN